MIRDMISNMKDFDKMDKDEKDTVLVGCLSGIAIGLGCASVVFACIAIVAVVVATQ